MARIDPVLTCPQCRRRVVLDFWDYAPQRSSWNKVVCNACNSVLQLPRKALFISGLVTYFVAGVVFSLAFYVLHVGKSPITLLVVFVIAICSAFYVGSRVCRR